MAKNDETSSQPDRVSSSPQSKSGRCRIINLTNRNIEIDRGRDKEIRIPAGQTVEADSDIIDTPEFRRERDRGSFVVQEKI